MPGPEDNWGFNTEQGYSIYDQGDIDYANTLLQGWDQYLGLIENWHSSVNPYFDIDQYIADHDISNLNLSSVSAFSPSEMASYGLSSLESQYAGQSYGGQSESGLVDYNNDGVVDILDSVSMDELGFTPSQIDAYVQSIVNEGGGGPVVEGTGYDFEEGATGEEIFETLGMTNEELMEMGYDVWHSGMTQGGTSGLTYTPSLSAIKDIEHAENVDVYDFMDDPETMTLADVLYDESGGQLGYLDIWMHESGGNWGIDPGAMVGEESDQFLVPYGADEAFKYGLGYGQEGGYFSLYNLGDYFEYDESSGRFVSTYDADKYEAKERADYEAGVRNLGQNLKNAIVQDAKKTGDTLAYQGTTVDDLQRLANYELQTLSNTLKDQQDLSRRGWYDEMRGHVGDIITQMDISTDAMDYSDRIAGIEDDELEFIGGTI